MPEGEKRDLVLNPGEQAFLQDVTTNGQVKTYVGPAVVNQTGQERPVVYDRGVFQACSLYDAVRRCPIAQEGDYIILHNPADTGEAGKEHAQNAQVAPRLQMGSKVIIPGPKTFALWPAQSAVVVKGHHLRSNEYLLCEVYNEEAARKNWKGAVVKAAAPSGGEGGKGEEKGEEKKDDKKSEPSVDISKAPADLTTGQRFIIKGTEYSFYIPPTGVEVIQGSDGEFVRAAVTLERLELAILIGEDGNKRYERGPQVVFPEPTETFFVDQDTHSTKFRAIELNHLQGLHIKVNAPYEDDDGTKHEEGDEIFLRGDECPIYYPREEHSILSYDDKKKHYAVAVPAGEGRYLMSRRTGDVRTEKGPAMLLPNPIEEVFVRRVLTDNQVDLWYPGNNEALLFNQQLRAQAEAQSVDAGFSDDARMVTERAYRGMTKAVRSSALAADASYADMPGQMKRGTKFTKPRELTLDTKYDGVPGIQPYNGYAVMVVSKSGKRRVVKGRDNILLDYDEELEVLNLSTGTPKREDHTIRTVYLRVANNRVSDQIEVQTADHVKVSVKLAMTVNFTGDANKWFAVENYVKLLTDRVRSMLKSAVRQIGVEKFYADGIAIVRDIVLGVKKKSGEDQKAKEGRRPGLLFEDNGMRVDDVDVVHLIIEDPDIAHMLESAQYDAVNASVKAQEDERQFEIFKREQHLQRLRDDQTTETELLRSQNSMRKREAQHNAATESSAMYLKEEEAKNALSELVEAGRDLGAKAALERAKTDADEKIRVMREELDIRRGAIESETKAAVERFEAAKEGFAQAVLAVSNNETMVKVANALSAQKLIGGDNVADVLNQIFKGTGLGDRFSKMLEQGLQGSNGKTEHEPAHSQ
jgi:major vault protein